MKMIRWGLALFIVAIGGIATVLVSLENSLAGTVTGLLVILCSGPLLFATRKSELGSAPPASNGTSLGVTAAAMRQGRAIARLDDGEISGAAGRSL
ncbi:MAG: hypothetical protein P1U50_10115 [Parvibaculaceae bacterium]|nr:hypothetical protein [Parvibaculaceae bacterium]